MPSTYPGDGSQPFQTVGPSTRKAITASTNANPIKVTCPGHGMNTGDTVEIENHTVNTNANGVRTITVVDANNFLLNGSTGNGVGTGTGYATDYEVQPALSLPLDGELVDMNGLGPALEALANTTPWIYRVAGKFRLYDIYQRYVNQPYANVWTSGPLTNSWGVLTGCYNLMSPAFQYIPHVQSGDILRVRFCTTLLVQGATASSDTAGFALGEGLVGNVGSVPINAAFGPPLNNVQTYTVQPSLGSGPYQTSYIPIVLEDMWPQSLLGPAATPWTFDVNLWGICNRASGMTFSLIGSYQTIVEHWRAN